MARKRHPTPRSTRTADGSGPKDVQKRREFFTRYVYYLEGLYEYSKVDHPYGDAKDDHRVVGWAIGRQVLGLYLVEMLLRIALERNGATHDTATHNLAHLFRKLPKDARDSVERVYKRILRSEVQWTWDICRSVASYLDFLGKNPIGRTRYPWQQKHQGTLFSPNSLRFLVTAILIALHRYPYAEGSLDKRFDTEFRSLAESRENRYDSKGNPTEP